MYYWTLVGSNDSNDWNVVNTALGDFSSCQVLSRDNSDEYLIKETECSSKQDSIHRIYGQLH
jgi:hypothetical protein